MEIFVGVGGNMYIDHVVNDDVSAEDKEDAGDDGKDGKEEGEEKEITCKENKMPRMQIHFFSETQVTASSDRIC
ncbi:Hypothetical predicted protein [Octopus vulgaris]|uniref:Uncharacterized protein n=1 Tax=Octopus vulgaris TaxID=6645 RepID=A0AA36FAR8_OCTVU|nr:Hypothetical predicted protein [Octopus vulgaris]